MKRRLLSLAALLAVLATSSALAADAPRPDDFVARFALTVPAGGPFYRFPLTADTYRYSRTQNLSDLRVFNAQGEAIAFALYEPKRARPQQTSTALAIYPIHAATLEAARAGGRMEVRQLAGETIVIVKGAGHVDGTDDKKKTAAWLIDAREIKQAAVALEFDAAFEAGRLIPVTLAASKDLKTWRTIVAGEPLYRLSGAAGLEARTRIELPAQTAVEGEFLRLTWAGSASFDLRGATLKTVPFAAPAVEAPRLELHAPLTTRAHEIEWRVPTPARFSQVELRLGETNSLLHVSIQGRSGAEPWRTIGRGVVYHLVRDGVEHTSPALDVEVGRIDAIKLVSDPNGAGFGAPPPAVWLRFAPREVVFLARGGGPFDLAVGRRDSIPAALTLAGLLPDYKADAENALPSATIGAPRVDERRAGDAPPRLFGLDVRTATLWAVLIGAVLLLSIFAFSIFRKANASQ